MAERYDALKRKKTPDLTSILNSMRPGMPTYGGDENINWTAVGRGVTSKSPTYTVPPSVLPNYSAQPAANTLSSPATSASTLRSGTANVPSSVTATGGQTQADIDAIIAREEAKRDSADSTNTGTGGTNSGYSPVDRSGYTSYAETIARLQNDPKILALKQKLASMKAGSTEQQQAIEAAYGSLPQQVMDFLGGQKQRITENYNQRGLYGSGMELGQLSQAEQAAQDSIAQANQNKANEITKILQDMGLFEQQTNEQLAQVQGSSGDTISQILQELNMQADQTDASGQQAAQQAALDQQRYLDQLAQQDWTNNFNQQQFNADQGWKQKNYGLDLQQLNASVANQQASAQEQAQQAAYDNASPTQQAIMNFGEYTNPTEAVTDWMAQRGAMENAGVNVWDVWNALAQQWGIPAQNNMKYGLSPEEALRRLRAGQTWR